MGRITFHGNPASYARVKTANLPRNENMEIGSSGVTRADMNFFPPKVHFLLISVGSILRMASGQPSRMQYGLVTSLVRRTRVGATTMTLCSAPQCARYNRCNPPSGVLGSPGLPPPKPRLFGPAVHPSVLMWRGGEGSWLPTTCERLGCAVISGAQDVLMTTPMPNTELRHEMSSPFRSNGSTGATRPPFIVQCFSHEAAVLIFLSRSFPYTLLL